MGKDKKPPKPQRPKQATGYRLRPALVEPAAKLAELRAYTVTDLINEAVRKELERESLWPPKPSGSASGDSLASDE